MKRRRKRRKTKSTAKRSKYRQKTVLPPTLRLYQASSAVATRTTLQSLRSGLVQRQVESYRAIMGKPTSWAAWSLHQRQRKPGLKPPLLRKKRSSKNLQDPNA